MVIQKSRRRPVRANDELVNVAPEAAELLFEAVDVGELIAEVTGQDVEVEVDENSGTAMFAVGEDVFTVEPDGTEEFVESSRVLRGKRNVAASANRQAASRTVRSDVPARNKNRRPAR